jgi:hypothetical protein
MAPLALEIRPVAVAHDILAEWRLADASPQFRAWPEGGAPSATLPWPPV